VHHKKLEEDHDLYKVLANTLYANVKDLDLVDIARDINRGDSVELDKTEIKSVEEVVTGERSPFTSVAKKAILDYIESIRAPK